MKLLRIPTAHDPQIPRPENQIKLQKKSGLPQGSYFSEEMLLTRALVSNDSGYKYND